MTYNNDREIDKEQFFTQKDTAERFAKWIKNQVWFSGINRIIEPSAGDGVWLDYLDITEAYDIEPKHPDVVEANYLETPIAYQSGTLIVGNPPFGRKASLAMKFINKGALEADYIAFILPASFGGKASIINSVHPNLHLVYQEEMFDEKFRTEDNDQVVRCVFQLWEKREDKRKKIILKATTEDFSFTTPQLADFAYVTHGHSHGKVIATNFTTRSKSTTAFIKVTDRNRIVEIRDRLANLDYKNYSKFTTKQPCISKKEIILAYETEFKKETK